LLIHERLMRPQQSAMRIAYNRLQNKWTEREIWGDLRDKFPFLTGRNVNDAITQAKGILASQFELLPVDTEKTKRALGKSKNAQITNKSRPLHKRVKSLYLKVNQLQEHQANGTVPPVIFGGQHAWKDVVRRLSSARAQWRHRRSNQFISRGAKNNRGNAHCRLVITQDSELELHIRVPDKIKKKKSKQTTSAIWLQFPISYSKQFDTQLRDLATLGAIGQVSYTVRVIRISHQTYRAFITCDEFVEHREFSTFEAMPNWVTTACGIDLNLDHIAICITDRNGQFRRWNTITYPNLGELPRPKSKWMIGNIARDAVDWVKSHNAEAIVLEDLSIRRSSQSSRTNRRTVPFAYRQLAQAITRRALRDGLAVKTINPAYTSWIGRVKFAPMYGISVHVAAAYVIGRRGFGLDERLPQKLINRFPKIIEIIDYLAYSPDIDTEKLQEWRNRLMDWKKHTPNAGRPWLLWATLHGIKRISSEARSIILG